MKKRLFAVMLSLALVLSTGFCCYAASSTVNLTLTSSKVSASYTYSRADRVMELDVYGHEKLKANSSTTQIKYLTKTVCGSYDISISDSADSGYSFTSASAYVYIEGTLTASNSTTV